MRYSFSLIDLLEDNENTRVLFTHEFLKKLQQKSNEKFITTLANKLNIHPKTLERKIKNKKGYSFLLREIKQIVSTFKIPINQIKKNIIAVKIGHNSKWISLFSLNVDEEFVEGIGFYIGDGRFTTKRSISIVNNEISILKFFLKWIKKYFAIYAKNIKVNIFIPRNFVNFNENKLRLEWAKKLEIYPKFINKIERRRGKKISMPLIEINFHSSTLKKFFDKIIIIVKKLILENIQFAQAYIRGILEAEGAVKYHEKSGSRQIQIKMKSKEHSELNNILLKKIGCIPSLRPTKDNEWVVILSGYDDLQKIKGIDGFKHHLKRKKKLESILQTYKRRHIKKGYVDKIYLSIIFNLQQTGLKKITTQDILKVFPRERTRIADVLKLLYTKGYLKRERIRQTGRPYIYALTQNGKNILHLF